jgi:hypothetical protein
MLIPIMARAPRICVAVIMMENLAHFQRFSSGRALTLGGFGA